MQLKYTNILAMTSNLPNLLVLTYSCIICTFRGLLSDDSKNPLVEFNLLHWPGLTHESVHVSHIANKVFDFFVPVDLGNKCLQL
jgi:hypothetical protein